MRRAAAGIITDGDLRRHMDGLMDHSAAEVMTRDPLTIAPDRWPKKRCG
jgi:arabinose-5-phosphate isomerase